MPVEQGWEALRWDPLRWLLSEEAGAGVQWRVLVELFHRPADSVAVRRARGGVGVWPPIASLLDPLQPDGSWNQSEREWQRFRGGVWRLVAAVELGADPDDPRLREACRRVLVSDELHGIADDGDPCEAARVLNAASRLGWSSDPTFLEVAQRLARRPEAADGGWECSRAAHAGSGSSCSVTAVATLGAADHYQHPALAPIRGRAAEMLLVNDLWVGRRAPRDWWRPTHPRLLSTDVIEACWAFARATPSGEPRMTAALARVQEMQDDRARWTTLRPPVQSVPIPVAERPKQGTPCRFLTLEAVAALLRLAVPLGLPRLFPRRGVRQPTLDGS